MDLLLTIVGWTAWAAIATLTYLVVPFLIWESTQDKNLPVSLEAIIYWIFLIPGSFLFTLSDINKLHIIWLFLLFGAAAWWINLTSYTWEYDHDRWITKITDTLTYGTDERTPRKFVFLWVGLSAVFLLALLTKKFVSPTINLLVDKKAMQIVGVGFAGLIAAGLVVVFLKTIVDNVSSPKCSACRNQLRPLEAGQPESMSISMMVQAGLAESIGYVCLACGKRFCQRCMENSGGMLSPGCNSPVKYLTETDT